MTVLCILIVTILYNTFTSFQELDSKTVEWYYTLKEKLHHKGYKANFFVISTQRPPWLNNLLPLSVPKSQHLQGKAIDIWVMDVNNDWRINIEDVRIVYDILDKEIVGDSGGLGLYLKQNYFSSKMVHFDSRGFRVRWNN